MTTPTSSDPTLSLLGNLFSSNTGKGAALGSLLGTLLSSYKGPGGVNVGVDMSKVGNIPTRTTTITPPRYVSYADYGAQDVQPQTITPELAKALGLPAGIQIPTAAQYTARPQMAAAAPQTITSAGTGANRMIMPTLTPKNATSLNPLIGGLLGASVGYLMPETPASQAAGATSTAAAKALWDKISGAFSGGATPSGGTTDTSGGTDSTSSIPSDVVLARDGGMVSPLMAANGGAVEDPSYYTFGQIVNPQDMLNQLAKGGEPKHGGLHVPVVEGRHDYRAGARVTGAGDGQSDDIPAMLADGEYVIDSETVAQLGNGSTKAGSDLLDKFREEIRSHKRSAPVNKIPPPSKSPLQYLAAAQKKVRS